MKFYQLEISDKDCIEFLESYSDKHVLSEGYEKLLALLNQIMEKINVQYPVFDPQANIIKQNITLMRDFINILYQALMPIPKNISPQELAKHPDVIKRMSARSKLIFDQIPNKLLKNKGDEQLLQKIESLPADQSRAKIDEKDTEILTTHIAVERGAMATTAGPSGLFFYNRNTGNDHDSMAGIYGQLFTMPKKNLDRLKVLAEIFDVIRIMNQKIEYHFFSTYYENLHA